MSYLVKIDQSKRLEGNKLSWILFRYSSCLFFAHMQLCPLPLICLLSNSKTIKWNKYGNVTVYQVLPHDHVAASCP